MEDLESYDQQPGEEAARQNEEEQVEARAEAQPESSLEAAAALQPIYEFPPDSSLPQAQASAPVFGSSESSQPSQPAQQQANAVALPVGLPLEEAVRRGLIYPPPPSFYQSMPDAVERPPLPPGRQPEGPQYPYRAGAQTMPPPYAPPAPGMATPPPVQKRSRKWIWIVASILGLALVVSCGLCGWAFYNIFNTSFQTSAGVISRVDDYYGAIESRNYAAAYKDLAPQGSISGLTQQDFIQQAQQRDQQYGEVTSYTFGQPSFTSNPTTGPDLSHMTITVNVARTHLNYVVVLSLSNIRGSWKITDFDRI